MNADRLTQEDINLVIAALELRFEACVENGELKDAAKWRALSSKMVSMYERPTGRSLDQMTENPTRE